MFRPAQGDVNSALTRCTNQGAGFSRGACEFTDSLHHANDQYFLSDLQSPRNVGPTITYDVYGSRTYYYPYLHEG